jgi:ubiquinol-cytochrome c reductase cytochrome c1 subunit
MSRPTIASLAITVSLGLGAAAVAATAVAPPAQQWSFSGMFGTFDRPSAQRGFQVYEEACHSCHGLKFIAFRNLTQLGFNPDQVAEIAAKYEVTAGPNDDGEMYQTPAKPADTVPSPFANDQAARVANNGALPPDLSLIVEARPGGADYIYGLLTGYRDPPPEGLTLNPGMYYNEYFPGHEIAMPPPLTDDRVTYTDGTQATVSQMSHDVVTFLTWAAEPNMEDRKRLGIKVILFLIVMTGFFYALKRQVWSDVSH